MLAINLLVKLTAEDMMCQYVTKNSAPREVYSKKLQTNYKKSYINNLFKGSGVFYEAQRNEFDALIVDEAHRLNEKSGLFKNKGENQTKEIIHASKFSIFFIDENQKVSTSDAGSKEEIIRFANLQDAEIVQMQLDSQFRCNGSDGYLAWLDDVLEIRDTANFDGFEFDYEFKVVDDPNELREIIRQKNKINNKARIVAGYCWEWNSKGKNDKDVHDIIMEEHNFSMSWNLGNSSTWAIDQDSVEQAGCIHTSQGLEFDYVGVIIGEDLRYENEGIIPDFTKRAKSDKSLNGQKGCYIYCVDKDLNQYFKQRLSQFHKHITYEMIENDIEMVSEESNLYRDK